MSCPKDTNILVRNELGKLIAPVVKRISKCKGQKSVYPSFTPVIDNISVNSSFFGVYTVVTIQGSNFLPPCNGNTYIKFGPYTNLPIIFYNSFYISFVVPLDAPVGFYTIQAVNVYNDNFSLPVSQSYFGKLNYSNSVPFTINSTIQLLFKLYRLYGSFILTSTYNYKHIITFTGTGSLNFLQPYNKIINFAIVYNDKSVVNGFFSKENKHSLIINKTETSFPPPALFDYPGNSLFISETQNTSSLKAIIYFNN